MKNRILPILMMLLTVVGIGSARAQTVIYSWDQGEESGGVATSTGDNEHVGMVQAIKVGEETVASYTVIRVSGKADKEVYVQITLDKALAGGEKISVTGFRNKNAVDKKSGFKAFFDKGGEVASSTGLEFINLDRSDASDGDSNRGTEPNTCEFTVPAEAAGSTVITIIRSHTQTNLFITKLVISKSEGDEPVEPVVTIAKPTFEIDGVTYESGATVPGVKTGQRITINVEEGMWIYTNWSGKTGKKVEDLHKEGNAPKAQTTYGASTSSGGQRVLSAVAGDTEDASGNASDIAYVILSDVVAGEPTFSPAAGEVEAGTVVTLTKGCKDDKVYYTTDGSDPTAESTAYTDEGITVNEDVTIKAIAFDKNSEYGSAVVTAAYTIPAAVVIPTPTSSPESGSTIAYGGEIAISYDEGYTLYYTTDGSDPKTSETAQLGFNQPETIIADQEGTLTVKAFLSNKDGDGEVVTATYTVEGKPIVVGAPTFDPAPGEVEAGTQVHIIFGENAQSVSFTTDGSDPLLADVWTSAKQIDALAPIIINDETTIKAICRAESGGKTVSSEVVTVTYTVKVPEVLPESNVEFDPAEAMPTTFDDWGDTFLIKKTDTKAGDKFTFITQPVEVEGWQWGPQILPKSNADWSNLCDALAPDADGNIVLELTKEMADVINANGGLRIQGMGIKVLAVQFEAGPDEPGPDEPIVIPDPEPLPENAVDLIDRFTGNWGGNESNTHYENKTISYNGVAWGGLSAWLEENNTPIDWSEYEKLVFVFAEPTTVNVQGFIQTTTEDIKYWGNPGITRLECPFEGKDVTAVKQAALQLSDPATIFITNIYLVKKDVVEPAPEFALTFNPESGTEVEAGNEITLTYDDEAFLLYYTTDNSDPKAAESDVKSAWGTDEIVTVAGTGEFVIKAYLENRKTNEQSEVFTATYPIKAAAVAEVTVSVEAGTEVEVDDEITIGFDGDNFQCWVTTDGSDPATSLTAMNWFPNEPVIVKGEGEFVLRIVLENNKTGEKTEVFTATYPIKAEEPVVADVTIVTKANGYGTFCYDKDLDFTASDAKAYIARLDGNRVILSEIQKVPAGTGILVKSGAKEAVVPTTEGVTPFNGINDFIGVLEDTEVEYGTVSILSLVNGEEGFYKFLGTTIPANRAYFPVVATGALAKFSLIFEDADGIGQIVNNAIVNGEAYNLNGQRVKSNYKGVVIIDGKKYYKK